ncbi:hypothetical protein MCM1_2011 [Methanosarcina barkeri CM1]|uniref:Uncharacterized protein n=1 Tax=Methanosarcina barkeri CM1 TaxID=796385 RepID=A0A0G3CIS8_METBA|nr:hypothetical protein MCM1_2011 [Methanosarcina barkeri CM1]
MRKFFSVQKPGAEFRIILRFFRAENKSVPFILLASSDACLFTVTAISPKLTIFNPLFPMVAPARIWDGPGMQLFVSQVTYMRSPPALPTLDVELSICNIEHLDTD